MIRSYSHWFPYNGDTVSIVLKVKFNENQYNSSITLIDLGFHNGMVYIMVATITFTSNTSVLPMIWSDTNYRGNAMVAMVKLQILLLIYHNP